VSLVSVVCCHIGVFASLDGLSRVALRACGGSECNRDATGNERALDHEGLLRHGSLKISSIFYNIVGA
jgi:hypothetical protein